MPECFLASGKTINTWSFRLDHNVLLASPLNDHQAIHKCKSNKPSGGMSKFDYNVSGVAWH